MNVQCSSLYVGVLSALLGLAACGQSGHVTPEEPLAAGDKSVDCTADTWGNYAQDFFATDCVMCHGAGTANDATTYAAVSSDANAVLAAISSGAMPLGGSLAPADKTRIEAWLTCGLPQGTAAAGSAAASGGGSSAQCTDTWTNYAQGFFMTNCVTCHPAGDAHDATTYTAVQAEASQAQTAIMTGLMPQGSTLMPADKQRILAWFACKMPQ